MTEDRLAAARAVDVDALADAIADIGFECTRCGACCRGTPDDPHVATVTPEEIRSLGGSADGEGRPWRDVAKPVPFGLTTGPDDRPRGEALEWALATDGCGDCTFYEDGDGQGTCTAYAERPLVCRTYPFSLELEGAVSPVGDVVERRGSLLAHECEGLGREIDRAEAVELARAVKERTIRDIEEEAAVLAARDREPETEPPLVVYDSEGPKDRDGRPLD